MSQDESKRNKLQGSEPPQATRPKEEQTLRSNSVKPRPLPTTGAVGPSLFPSAGTEGLKERLADIGVFGGLSDSAREFFVDTCQFVKLAIGEVAFKEGDPGREMYVLLSGELEVLKRSRRGRDTRVAILGPSDCFGEMSVIDLQPRSATLRALAPTKLLRISAEDLDLLYRTDVKAYAMLVLNIARDLSRRLRVADGLVAQVTATMLDEYSKARA